MVEASPADLGKRLASELEAAAAMLEENAVTLCLDPVVFERHAERLQRFDLLAQTVREVARLLRNWPVETGAIANVRLEEMALRLIGPGRMR